MVMTSVVISIVLTLGILVLSLVTISKGYDYEHTIDPKPDTNPNEESRQEGKRKENA